MNIKIYSIINKGEKMKKLITLDKNVNISQNIIIKDFFDPNYIYIPVENDILIDEDDHSVLINQEIYKNHDKNYNASISGEIKELVEKQKDGKSIDCLKIKNDYKEKKQKTKKESIKDLDKNVLHSLINKYNYSSSNPKNLIINCIVDEPFVFNEHTYLEKYSEQILETADLISQKFNVANVFVVVKNIDSKNINSFLSIMGSFISFKLILLEDKYLIGNQYFLLKHLNLENTNTIILKPSEIYSLYNRIYYKKNLVTKNITIAGNVLKNTFVINCKLYVSLLEILEYCNIKIPNNTMIIKNSLMAGKNVSLDEIIDENTEAYFLMENSHNLQSECLKCGKCYEICPLNINPKYSYDEKKPNKHCIECGLCNYICPANINLLEFLKGDKHD